MLRTRVVARLVVGAVSVLVTGGCTSDSAPETDDTTMTADTTPISVTIPPSRLTPFCEAMIELTDTVLGDPALDAKTLIIDTYRSIQSEVPDEIAGDFSAVLTELESGVTAPTLPPVTQPAAPSGTGTAGSTPISDPESSEFFFGGSTPSERINEYVAFACRDVQNNPGPAATEPLEGDRNTTPDAG